MSSGIVSDQEMLEKMTTRERHEWLMRTFVEFVDDGLERDEISAKIQEIIQLDDRSVIEEVVSQLYSEAEERGFLEVVPSR